jgi:hypothetical protein
MLFQFFVGLLRALFQCDHRFGVGVFSDHLQRKYEVCVKCGRRFYL